MFKSIETTEVTFTKQSKVKTRRPTIVRRQATPMPTDDDILQHMTRQLDIRQDLPAIPEEVSPKRAKPI